MTHPLTAKYLSFSETMDNKFGLNNIANIVKTPSAVSVSDSAFHSNRCFIWGNTAQVFYFRDTSNFIQVPRFDGCGCGWRGGNYGKIGPKEYVFYFFWNACVAFPKRVPLKERTNRIFENIFIKTTINYKIKEIISVRR